jgi:hypothetical protein
VSLRITRPRKAQEPRLETPQCCVPVPPPAHNPDWRQRRVAAQVEKHGWDPKLCLRQSVLFIGEKPYCRIHAGAEVLDMWTRGELVERQP